MDCIGLRYSSQILHISIRVNTISPLDGIACESSVGTGYRLSAADTHKYAEALGKMGR